MKKSEFYEDWTSTEKIIYNQDIIFDLQTQLNRNIRSMRAILGAFRIIEKFNLEKYLGIKPSYRFNQSIRFNDLNINVKYLAEMIVDYNKCLQKDLTFFIEDSKTDQLKIYSGGK